MRPVPDKPILLGGGSETVPDGWHVVYQCPLCRRYFDSPSVCLSDGAEAIPRLERKPRLARRDWSAGTDVASGGDGVSVADQTRTKITHGRHCICTPCRVEDWTNPALAPCGMHGRGCPQEYAPLGAAGDPVPAADLIEKGDTDA